MSGVRYEAPTRQLKMSAALNAMPIFACPSTTGKSKVTLS